MSVAKPSSSGPLPRATTRVAPTKMLINGRHPEKFTTGLLDRKTGQVLGDFSLTPASELPAFLVWADDLPDRDLDAECGARLDGPEAFQLAFSLRGGKRFCGLAGFLPFHACRGSS